MATLTTSPQIVGSNTSGGIKTYLYAWYGNQSGTTCTVYVRLTAVSTIQYTGTNKSYALKVGGYDSGTNSWAYAPLEAGVEYTVAEASYSYSSGAKISASALFWSYVYGSADIDLSGSWYVPTFTSPPTGVSLSNITSYRDGFRAKVSVTDWGTSSQTTKQFTLSVCAVAGSTANRRYTVGDAYTSPEELTKYRYITVTNSSSLEGSLTIKPNTTYYLTVYASNGDKGAGNTTFVAAKTLAAIYIESNGKTKTPTKLYIESNGKTKAPTKMYAIQNGKTKRAW